MKPSNILLDSDGYIKIADFGLAIRNVDIGNPARTFCGSPAYLSPEILNNTGVWKPSDVYSIGVVLFEMLVGETPFYTEKLGVLYSRIINDEINFPDDIPWKAKDLI